MKAAALRSKVPTHVPSVRVLVIHGGYMQLSSFRSAMKRLTDNNFDFDSKDADNRASDGEPKYERPTSVFYSFTT